METHCINEEYQKSSKVIHLHKSIITFTFTKYVEMLRIGLSIDISNTNIIFYK